MQKKAARKYGKALEQSLKRAFKATKLNPKSKSDKELLLFWLAWAIYGGRGPGAPKTWTKLLLRQLRDTVDEMRRADPKLTEENCCKLLSRGAAADGLYKNKKASTLRRVLQKAKSLKSSVTSSATVETKIFNDGQALR
jgi:hypothetical protein